MLLSSYLFREFSPAAVQAVAAAAKRRACDAGSFAFRVGDPADAIFVVASGQLKECLITGDGEELVFEIFTAGAVFGEPGLFVPERNRVVNVIAMVHSELLALPRERIIEFALAHPPVLLRLLEGVAAQARTLVGDSARIAYRPIRDRLAIKLLELAATHGQPDGDGIQIALDISQSALAGMIGASRENVNRALRALSDIGAAEICKGRIARLHPRQLSRAASASSQLYRRNRLLSARQQPRNT